MVQCTQSLAQNYVPYIIIKTSKPIFMLKNFIIIIAILLSFPSGIFASDTEDSNPEDFNPEAYIKEQKKLHVEKIKEANQKYLDAKKNREQKIKNAIREYIEAVKKTKKYWTEKGNLEKALIYKSLQEKLEQSLKKKRD
jgi:hypothetical protein